jgi:hypothetical protein
MNIIKSYVEGFKKTYSLKKVVTIIYGITFSLGLILAAAFFSSTSENFSARPAVQTLLKDFNATVYFDLINNYNYLIEPFMGMIIWFGVFYFFFTVFFAGGIIKLFDGSSVKSKAQAFFAGSAKYFFRFLRLGIYTLMVQVIALIIIAAGFSVVFDHASQTSAEPKLFTIIVVWISVHILVYSFFVVVSDYAKIILVKEDSKKVIKALWHSLAFSVRKLYATYPLYLIGLIAPLILFGLYFVLDDFIGMKNGITVLIMFLIQQMFIWCRLFAKVWILGGEYSLFTEHLMMKERLLINQEISTNESL